MGQEPDPSDAALLAAAASDPEALAAFYRRHERDVAAFIRRRTGSAELTADLTAEVFAAVLVSCRSGELPVGREHAWLFGIVQHKLIDSYRRGQVQDAARRALRMRPVAISAASFERVDALADETPALDLVESLPADQRDAIIGRVLDERSYDEIAGELGVSEQVVRKRVSRGLSRLRGLIGGGTP